MLLPLTLALALSAGSNTRRHHTHHATATYVSHTATTHNTAQAILTTAKAQRRATTPLLTAAANADDAAVDLPALAKYAGATAAQFSLIAVLFKATDALLPRPLPAPLAAALFGFLSLRSRFFSPLAAQRPDRSQQAGGATPVETKRPSWTPPGIAFPIIWLTITGLRATSAALVYRAAGSALATPPLLALALHLCVGDTWNSITNVEGRLGTSAVGVLFVLASVLHAVGRFAAVSPVAAAILAPSAVWISVATVLTWTIWSMNKPRQPFWPRLGDGKSTPLRLPFKIFEKTTILPKQVEPGVVAAPPPPPPAAEVAPPPPPPPAAQAAPPPAPAPAPPPTSVAASSYQRKPGVTPPTELEAFVAAAGSSLIVFDVRDPSPDAIPEPSAKVEPIASPTSGSRPRAVNVPYDRRTGTVDLNGVPSSWLAGGIESVPVITHCGGGGRGGLAKEYLESQGWKNVVNGGGPEDPECWAVFGSK